ncbi:7668_t:CDS:2 [Gigaspora margarita]|uniref:7668_t:CDS:1 n=1 Tax=Gigaspora margarita TaxID=4874 RepID=A0ABM8W581_GIGMA|nr:7668_t:CDS:2 [Gigaspora margarita]
MPPQLLVGEIKEEARLAEDENFIQEQENNKHTYTLFPLREMIKAFRLSKF